MTWRAAESLDVLLAEINKLAPKRSKAVDGTIGDDAHAARASDHNPSGGIVHARDFTHDPNRGADMGKFFEALRTNPHPALKYVIFNRRIASRTFGFISRRYFGSSPHTEHMHVSVLSGSVADSRQPWGLLAKPGTYLRVGAYKYGRLQRVLWDLDAWHGKAYSRDFVEFRPVGKDLFVMLFGPLSDKSATILRKRAIIAVFGFPGPFSVRKQTPWAYARARYLLSPSKVRLIRR